MAGHALWHSNQHNMPDGSPARDRETRNTHALSRLLWRGVAEWNRRRKREQKHGRDAACIVRERQTTRTLLLGKVIFN